MNWWIICIPPDQPWLWSWGAARSVSCPLMAKLGSCSNSCVVTAVQAPRTHRLRSPTLGGWWAAWRTCAASPQSACRRGGWRSGRTRCVRRSDRSRGSGERNDGPDGSGKEGEEANCGGVQVGPIPPELHTQSTCSPPPALAFGSTCKRDTWTKHKVHSCHVRSRVWRWACFSVKQEGCTRTNTKSTWAEALRKNRTGTRLKEHEVTVAATAVFKIIMAVPHHLWGKSLCLLQVQLLHCEFISRRFRKEIEN